MNKHAVIFYVLIAMLQLYFTSCLSNRFASAPDALLKNWDTVNMVLESYCGNSFDVLTADFGSDYLEGEEFCVFHTDSQESSITFFVKKGKVKGYSYEGSYADILTFLDKKSKYKNPDIQIASNAWIGFSPDLLKETFDSFVVSSTDKVIIVGPSESVCVEFTVATYSASGANATSTEEKRYVKKAKVKGTYAELKDYIVKVPDGSVQVKKIKQKNL